MTPTAIKAIPPIVMQFRVKLFGAVRVLTNEVGSQRMKARSRLRVFALGTLFFIVYRLSSDCIMTFK